MQQNKVKAYQLRKSDEPSLLLGLNKLKEELVGLRTQKVSSAPQVKLARIRVSNNFCCSMVQTVRNSHKITSDL